MRKWQCTVCGYIHIGDEPPETCPVCGADRSKFIEITDTDKTVAADAPNDKPFPASPPSVSDFRSSNWFDFAHNLMIKHHLHPISVHVPNGIIPAIIVFVFLSLFFHRLGFSTAAFYNTVFVMISLPVVLYSGFNEWKRKYKGAMTKIFITKITAACVVTATVIISVVCYLINPEILYTPSVFRTGFLLLQLVMLAATAVAGYIGGKLVFKD